MPVKSAPAPVTSLKDIAEALARLIPGLVVGPTTDVHTSVERADGMGFSIWVDYRGKMEVSGLYPKERGFGDLIPYGMTRPTIGCSLTRSADAIALDIYRRLYPEYLPVFIAAKERLADWEASAARYKAHVEGFKAWAEGKGIEVRLRGERTSWTFDAHNVDGQFSETGVYKLELRSLTLDQAQRILEIMKG